MFGNKLVEEEQIPEGRQMLAFGSGEVEDDYLLNRNGSTSDSSLHLLVKDVGMVHVHIVMERGS